MGPTVLLVLACLTVACTSAEDRADSGPALDVRDLSPATEAAPDQAPDLPGTPWPAPLPALLAQDGQLLVQGQIDGSSALLALDTGAFPTAVDRRFGGGGVLAKVDLVLGPITRDALSVAVADLGPASALIGADLGALVGSDVLGTWYVGLDYEQPAVYLQDRPPAGWPPRGSGDPAAAPFAQVLGVPVVSATLVHGAHEARVKLIADTGSGVTLLTRSTFDALDPDGELPRLEGYTWLTNSGSTAGFVTRIPALRVGQAEVAGSWAVVVPDNHHLAGALKLAGLPAGFLGFPFYRAFLTVYAGPQRRYLFYPGPAWRGQEQEWIRVGVELARAGTGFSVAMVYRPTSASLGGVRPGDTLLAVDGQPLEQRTLADATRLLRGSPGQRRRLLLSRRQILLDVEVQVEDLLPLLR